jgi:ribosomal protein S18 acetylase RimI-like enzyme
VVHRQVATPGGGRLTVRAIGPGDVDGLMALYAGLSDDDRYRRFFSYYDPGRAFFERAAAVESRGGYGLVAVEEDGDDDGADEGGGGRIVAEAGYELLPNGDGELAMAVAPGHRGWLGPFLLDTLIEAAAARGVPNIEADVQVTNRRMLALLRSRGYATLSSDDWVSVRLMVGTAGRTPVWPDRSDLAYPGPRVLVEGPGGRWHAAREAEAAGLQVVTCSGPRGARSQCPLLAGQPCPLVAGADAVVVSHPRDDDQWHDLVEAHQRLHPGVPVCIEPTPTAAGAPATPAPVPEGATVIEADEPKLVVRIVDRLAGAHRRQTATAPGPRSVRPSAPPPR